MSFLFMLAGMNIVYNHLYTNEINEKAQKRLQDAQNLYNGAKDSLEQAKDKTEKALLKLDNKKRDVLDTSIKKFLATYDKIKHIQVTESISINEFSKFTIDEQAVIELREMANVYSPLKKVAAVNAGGVAGIVASEGIAGLSINFMGLAAIAIPVVVFTEIFASIKAHENLEKADVTYAEAEAASEKMKTAETLCGGIYRKSEMYYELLVNLNKLFAECTDLLSELVRKKENQFFRKIFKKKLTIDDFTEEDFKCIALSRALAGAVKSVIAFPIFSEDGNLSYEAQDRYDEIVERLPEFGSAVQEVNAQFS